MRASRSADEAAGRRAVVGFIADETLRVRVPGVTRVGVDGVDGAGKTTFADELAGALAPSGRQIIRVCADDFLNPRDVRYLRGRSSPEGFFLDSCMGLAPLVTTALAATSTTSWW